MRDRDRFFRKVYDLDDSNITIMFPHVVTQLVALKRAYGDLPMSRMISILQGVCLAEGITPTYSKVSVEEKRKMEKLKRDRETAARRQMAKERLEEERREMGGAFPDRIKNVRKKMGDY